MTPSGWLCISARIVPNGREWAEQALEKMNCQTQADVRAVVAAIQISRDEGSRKFAELRDARGWQFVEGAAVADVAKALAGVV